MKEQLAIAFDMADKLGYGRHSNKFAAMSCLYWLCISRGQIDPACNIYNINISEGLHSGE